MCFHRCIFLLSIDSVKCIIHSVSRMGVMNSWKDLSEASIFYFLTHYYIRLDRYYNITQCD